MKILVLSFYYPPDIGPGPLRAQSLVNALLKLKTTELNIDVLTTMPNRYQTHTVEAASVEIIDDVVIRRFCLPTHQSGIADQAKAFGFFAKASLHSTRRHDYDIVVATSSRLMTAALGAWVARRVKAKLYLDIRDIFTDTMDDILASSPFRILMPIFRVLESWTFKSACKINVVSAGFVPHIYQVAPLILPSVFTNGIDDEFIDSDFFSPDSQDLPLVFYAGNMGEGQGLHHIIPFVAAATNGRFNFKLVGDGGRRKILQEKLKEKNLTNVQILDPVRRAELLQYYREADVLFLHLNDLKSFHKVLPSKIFEYAATGKPILAGVSGYAAKFLKEKVHGVQVFDPCNAEAMSIGLEKLLNGPKRIDRSEFCDMFSRQKIMRKMAADVFSMIDYA